MKATKVPTIKLQEPLIVRGLTAVDLEREPLDSKVISDIKLKDVSTRADLVVMKLNHYNPERNLVSEDCVLSRKRKEKLLKCTLKTI